MKVETSKNTWNSVIASIKPKSIQSRTKTFLFQTGIVSECEREIMSELMSNYILITGSLHGKRRTVRMQTSSLSTDLRRDGHFRIKGRSLREDSIGLMKPNKMER